MWSSWNSGWFDGEGVGLTKTLEHLVIEELADFRWDAMLRDVFSTNRYHVHSVLNPVVNIIVESSNIKCLYNTAISVQVTKVGTRYRPAENGAGTGRYGTVPHLVPPRSPSK